MRARWLRGGLLVEVGADALVIDAPPGVAEEIGADLGRIRAVVLTTGRARSVAGLIELLSALEAHRPPDLPLPLHLPLGEERGAALAEVWANHWDRYPLVIDAQRPGSGFQVGEIEVETVAIRVGEPRWHPERVERRVGMGLKVSSDGRRVVALLGAAPAPELERTCAGADLAVIEVGVAPWPRTTEPWRLRADEALVIGARAREVWVVGDDGQRLDLAES